MSLRILDRESWIREFVIRRNNALFGVSTWDIRFSLYNRTSNTVGEVAAPVLTVTRADGNCEWLGPGCVRVTLTQAQCFALRLWNQKEFATELVIVEPVTVIDPSGLARVVLTGVLDFETTSEPVKPLGLRNY